ncbi:leucine-rich repeat domain-containing protein [Microcoleus sp. herbarium5]
MSDIKPLESLTNLKQLDLNGNDISDIKPLESLTNLT